MDNKLLNDIKTMGWRKTILFILMIFMMASVLFLPRAFLSSGVILFCAVSILHKKIFEQVRVFFHSPLLWGISILFLLPVISGLWSDDHAEWIKAVRIKLPLLFIPIAFANPINFSKKYWEKFAGIFILFVFAGTIWSMLQYVPAMQDVHAGYLRSVLIKTPLENDHVRFSWLISVAVFASGYLCWQHRKTSSIISWLLLIAAVWMILFLHILAARTGLFCLYAGAFFIGLWLAFQKTKKIHGLILLIVIIALPLIAYNTFPTFHNRVKYFLYDLPYFKKADYLPGGNDAMRVISMKAGWNIMNSYPFSGVGFGDIKSKTFEWYEREYPQMNEKDKILPGSEWLVYGAGAGWPGFIVYSLVMILPFFLLRTKKYFLWLLISLTTALTFLFDIGLETQFGIFLYAFILLWWWKWIKTES